MSTEKEQAPSQESQTADAQAETEQEAHPGHLGTPIQPPLTVFVEGPGEILQVESGETWTSNVITESTVKVKATIRSHEDLADALDLGGSNFQHNHRDYTHSQMLQWTLEQADIPGLQEPGYQERKEWTVEVSGSVESYLDLADEAAERAGRGVSDGQKLLEILDERGIFCESLTLARAEMAKQQEESMEILLESLLERYEDDD